MGNSASSSVTDQPPQETEMASAQREASLEEGDSSSMLHKISSSFSFGRGGEPAGAVDEDAESSTSPSSWLPMKFGEAASQEDEEWDFISYFELTRTQRLYGFLICFVMGSFMSMTSSLFVGMVLLKPTKFAIPYTLGNLLSVFSSFFLMGPRRQCQTLCSADRAACSTVYFVMIFATLFCAFYLKSWLLTLLSVGAQFCSLMWLYASYLPFGRSMLKSCVVGCATRWCGGN